MPLALAVKAITAAAAASAAVAAGLFGFPPESPAPFQTVAITLKDGSHLEAGRDEITRDLWMQCATEGGCSYTPDTGPKAGAYPVTHINALDIAEFVTWLNQHTHANWRLPTRDEALEVAALLPEDDSEKLFTDPRMAWAAEYTSRKEYGRAVRPSGAFGTVSNCLRDIAGNVWEWTSTCTAKNIGNFPCPAFYVSGEHETEIPTFLRDAISGGCAAGVPPTNLGFRLVRDR